MASKPGYLLVMGTALDAATMNRYQAMIPPIYRHHQGYRLVMGEPPDEATFLMGGLNNLGVMLACFPSLSHVSDFWWSDDYRKAYSVREQAGRFSVIGFSGLGREPQPLPGGRSYLSVLATQGSSAQWRRFIDPLADELRNRDATILADAGPGATERLEGSMLASHIFVAVMPEGESAKSTWATLDPTFDALTASVEPMNIAALEGLPDGHPERLI